VVELAWSYDPESYAGGSVATGRITLAGQVKGDDADKKGYTGPQSWGVWRRVDNDNPAPLRALTVEKF
jgi:hypothetical protein